MNNTKDEECVGILPLNEYGWLSEGVHDYALEDTVTWFGGFQRSDRQPQLWAKFLEFVGEAQTCGLLGSIVGDGSFVTAEPVPNDIDLLLGGVGELRFVGKLST